MNFEKSKKIFNYRPLVSVWLFFMAGTLFSLAFFVRETVFYIVSALMFSCLAITFVIKLIKAKDKKLFKILSILIAFIIGGGISSLMLYRYESTYNISGFYYVNGRVSERVYKTESGQKVVSLDHVLLINPENGEEKELGCEVRLYLREADGNADLYALGEYISSAVNLKKTEYYSDGKLNFYMLNKGIRLIGFGSEENSFSLQKKNENFFDKIKVNVKEVLDRHLSSEYSELGYTMLFGDKSGLDENMYDSYSASGIGHLLAVSGLHVGFIVTLLSLVLALFKANNKVKFIIISIFIFLYAFACGFSVSVTRAFIMTVVLLFSKCRGKRYDSLSSLAVAGMIILLFNPMWIFDVGFVLSFSAVASIILFAPAITKFFSRFLHDKLASALAISVATSLGTSFPMIISFSKLSIFAVVTNVIVIPIASIAFMFMFAFVILSFIIKPLGVFIFMFEALMRVVTTVSSLTGALSLAKFNQILVFTFGFMLLLTSFTMTDHIFIKKKKRVVLGSVLGFLTLVSFVLIFIC